MPTAVKLRDSYTPPVSRVPENETVTERRERTAKMLDYLVEKDRDIISELANR